MYIYLNKHEDTYEKYMEAINFAYLREMKMGSLVLLTFS